MRKDGSRFWANVIVTALRDPAGAVVGFAKVTRDLTARRMAQEELRISEQRFRFLVEGVTDYAIYMLTEEGRVATWNAGAERLTGYTADEIIGRDFAMFFPQGAVEAGQPAKELELAREQGRFEEEGWRVRKDGTKLWANVIVTAVRDGSHRLGGFAKSVDAPAHCPFLGDPERLQQVMGNLLSNAVNELEPGSLSRPGAAPVRLASTSARPLPLATRSAHFSARAPYWSTVPIARNQLGRRFRAG